MKAVGGKKLNRRDVLKAGATLALAGIRRSAAGATADPNTPLLEVSSKIGLRVAVFPDGRYQITAASYGWTFGGTVGHALQNARVSDGSDGVGDWHEIAFDYDTARHSAIRIYEDKAVVLFSTSYGQDSANTDYFPRFNSFPQGLFTFSYTTLWNYAFGTLENHSPWLFYDAQANAILFSPASNFMTAYSRITSAGDVAAGIDGRIATLPAGFSHYTVLALGHGINDCFDTWGRALSDWHGKVRPANDAITLLNKLSYWTDASTAYYYRPSDPTQYVPTLLAVRSTFEKLSIPIGSMELDSWHYDKGSPPAWNKNTASGLSSFHADSSIFPSGLSAFQRSLGVPLITHSRWIDAGSDLRNQYKVSGNVAIDPKYWQDYAKYMVDNGVEVLEQDWLSGPAFTDFNLTDPDAFLDNMASSLQAAGRSIVYCMPTSPHLMQSVKYNNVVAARVAHDGLQRDHWDEMLLISRFAGAAGLWPFADAYASGKVKDLLLSVLTAGPVGSGEALGSIDTVSLNEAVRRDGVIVKPDAPIYPVDDSWVARSQNQSAPLIASTFTDHGAGVRTAYVFAYSRVPGSLSPISFSPQSLGFSGPAYVYDYFAKTGAVVQSGSLSTHTVDYNASYFIVAPIGPSGIAFLGDSGKFVSCGKKRIEQLSDDGTMRVVVRFAPGETHVQLHLHSSVRPSVAADSGHAGFAFPQGHGLYRVTVSPDTSGVAVV
ncbi:MAG TPA: hypothetical protein VGV35_18070, partial [Bryobacteraceae bacterium]|nr:hypothetical protein [Bryobacteraceae bacterium]